MLFGIADEVPHNQEIIDKSHVFYNLEFVVQTVLMVRIGFRIPFPDAFPAKAFQIGICRKAFGHIKLRQLILSEFDLDVTTFGNLFGIVKCFPGIRKKRFHFVFGFQVILSTLIAHPVLVADLCLGLNAQKNVVSSSILRRNIMHIIRADHRNAGLPVQFQNALVDSLLVGNAVVLHL